MKRSCKVATVVDQEKKRPEKAAARTKTKQKNNKKDIKNASEFNAEQSNVIKIILKVQNSVASSKKCLAELSKVYTSVSIIKEYSESSAPFCSLKN